MFSAFYQNHPKRCNVGDTLRALIFDEEGNEVNPEDVDAEIQWFADGVEITDETDAEYTVLVGDVGVVLSVEVTIGDETYTAETEEVEPAEEPVEELTVTIVSEDEIPTVGELLTAVVTDEDGEVVDAELLHYQWYAGEDAIDESDTAILLVTDEFVGKTLSVEVTDADGNTFKSEPTAEVEAAEVEELTVSIDNTTPKVGDILTAEVVDRNGEDVSDNVTFQWYADDVAIEGADEEILVVDNELLGAALKVVVTAENGNTFESEETEAVVLSDTEAPEIVEASVADAWTLEVEFDEDIFEGDDFAVTVSLGETEIDVDTDIDGTTLKITKDDASSFAAGTYTITITDVEDEYGNASEEDLEAEVTKDNSYAAGFSSYEGYMAEYNKIDEKTNPTQNRKLHVAVTDQYGETISSALSATYGAVKTKATIKSTGSIITSRFNKTGEEIDGQTMAYVIIEADKECVAGETLVVELTNSIDGTPYVSSFEVEIVGYDLVDTADTVTALTQTTVKADVNKQFVEGIDGGVLKMSDNNEVGLVATVVDFTGATATKGMVKFVSSDPSVIKVWDPAKGSYRDNAIVEAATKGNGYGADDAKFGVWFKALKPGEATITAYATGNIEDAYTFDVEVEGAELAIAGTESYSGEINYLPLTGTAGLDDAVITGTRGTVWTEDDEGDRTEIVPGTLQLNEYLATGSKKDKDNGLEKGERYLVFDATGYKAQTTYVYEVSAEANGAGTTLAETEEIEVYMRPRIKVDSDVQATSGIFVGADDQNAVTASTAKPAKGGTAINTPVDKIEDNTGNTQTGLKGVPIYAAINVVNTAPMQIGNYAAGQIKYTWSEDTVGSAKVNISNVYDNDDDTTANINNVNTNLVTNGTALLTITPTTEEVIGKLTLSIGGKEKELTINLGKAPVATGTIKAEWVDDGKAALITGTNSDADKAFDGSTAADHKVKLTVKDQYGNKIDPTLGGTVGTTALRLADANGTSNPFTIADELTVTVATTANPGELEATFSNMAPGEHELTFYIGERTTISKDDPQATITVNFVQKKDLTEIVPQTSVKWADDDTTTNTTFAGLQGKFGDAITLTSGAEAAGVFLRTANDTTITPSAKVYAGETEVVGVPITWTILDEELSFTETWIATDDTPAGSKTVKSTVGEWAAIAAGVNKPIVIDPTKTTSLTVTDGAGETYDLAGAGTGGPRIATQEGAWTDTQAVGGLDLQTLMDYAALADSGKSSTVAASIHLNATVGTTDLDAQSYVHLSTAGMSFDVDDIYVAYGNNTGADVTVTEGAKIEDGIKVKAKTAGTGTKVRVIAVDSVYGAELYDESANMFVTSASIVGIDNTAATTTGPTAGVVNVKANDGTAGKTASLRLEVTNGTKTRYINTPLNIVK